MLRKLSVVGCIASLAAFSGCAYIGPNTRAPQETSHVYKKNYEIGVKHSAHIGEDIIEAKDYFVMKRPQNRLRASRDFTINVSGVGSYNASKGDEYEVQAVAGENGRTNYVIKFPPWPHIRFCIDSDGAMSDRLLGEFDQKLAATPSVDPADVKFTFVTAEEIDRDKEYVNYEMVLTGITEKNISMLYREYSKEGTASEAFYQNLTYPNSHTIRFKNMVIYANSVDSKQIEYVVVKDGFSRNE